MHTEIDAVLSAHHGVAHRSDLIAATSRAMVDDLLRRGHLLAVFPRAYARPWDADQPDVELRAALTSVGGDAALSHVTSLARWALPVPQRQPIHVTAYNPRHPRGVPGRLVVHRTLLPLDAVDLDGLPTTRPEMAAVTSWPLTIGDEQRAAVIEGTRRGLFSAARLLDLAERMWWLPRLGDLRDLVALLAAGCESELELWGYTDVFDVPGLDDATRQLRVRVAGRSYRLDLAYEQERLAVELDGRAYHSSREQWERDIARDLALATIGWQTVRLSHARLRQDVEGCRRDVVAVRASRRRRVG